MELNKIKKILTITLISILFISGFGTGTYQKNNVESVHKNTLTSYDMVIIAPQSYANVLQPMIDHKNNYGISCFLKSTESIYISYNGRDEAEKIKLFVKDALETYTIKYVLLFGGKTFLGLKWNVPARYAAIDDGSGYTRFLSDLYFADIYNNKGEFEDWDSNGNDIFAEWGFTGDNLDLIPDVSVGRLPVRSVDEASNVIDKIISYEKNTFDQPWFNRMVVIGGDTFPSYEGIEGESTCEIAASFMPNFDIIRLYTSMGSLTGSNEIVTTINNGCGFLLTRGRGGQDRIRMVNPGGDEIIVFQIDDISKLSNDQMYPICILGECIHGKFDVCLFNILHLILGKPGYTSLDCILECIAWRLVREQKAGAIAVLTNTNICYGAFGDADENGVLDDAETFGGFLAVEFFNLYNQEESEMLGDLHVKTLKNYINNFPVQTQKVHCKSLMEFILIGDPSLKIGGYA